MPNRPIILTDRQLRAVQEGRLTQIRVPVVPQPSYRHPYHEGIDENGVVTFDNGETGEMRKCPFQPGDILYVREAWTVGDTSDDAVLFYYKADGTSKWVTTGEEFALKMAGLVEYLEVYGNGGNNWRSPATMPREAARLFLPVGEVRVQRLGDATEEDIVREGLSFPYDTPEEETMTLQEAWDARYARKYPWAEGLWTFVGTVS